MEALGEEEGHGKILFSEPELGGAVLEGAVLSAVIAVPAASRKTTGIITNEARSLPGLDLGSEGRGEV